MAGMPVPLTIDEDSELPHVQPIVLERLLQVPLPGQEVIAKFGSFRHHMCMDSVIGQRDPQTHHTGIRRVYFQLQGLVGFVSRCLNI